MGTTSARCVKCRRSWSKRCKWWRMARRIGFQDNRHGRQLCEDVFWLRITRPLRGRGHHSSSMWTPPEVQSASWRLWWAQIVDYNDWRGARARKKFISRSQKSWKTNFSIEIMDFKDFHDFSTLDLITMDQDGGVNSRLSNWTAPMSGLMCLECRNELGTHLILDLKVGIFKFMWCMWW